ncbi:MAG: hypothetical protein GC154_02505 [bacterium]|nr:hypothetical protein [bacterium]
MTFKQPEERFADEVTRGLWIWPNRRREARREILDHIEDAAEENKIDRWTDASLREKIGPPRKLRKMFIRGGLPWWMRVLKWCAVLAAFAFALLIAFDLWVLWLYPIPQAWRDAVDKQNAADQVVAVFQAKPIKLKWIEPGDESRNLLDRLQQAQTILDDYYHQKEEALNQTLETRRQQAVADGITGATKDEILIAYWREFMAPMTEGMGAMPGGVPYDPAEAERLWLLNKRGEPVKTAAMPARDFDRLYQLFTNIPSDAIIRFPKPEVTPEDIELAQSIMDGIAKKEPFQIPRGQEDMTSGQYEWMWKSALFNSLSVYTRFPTPDDFSLEDTIRRVKELFAAQQYTTRFYHIAEVLYFPSPGEVDPKRENIVLDPSCYIGQERGPQLIAAHARWTRLFAGVIDSAPEPMMDWLILDGEARRVITMLQSFIESRADLSRYKDALNEFASIDFDKVSSLWPEELKQQDRSGSDAKDFNPFNMMPKRSDQIAIGFSHFALFRVQCSHMQLFYSHESRGYRRYEALKNLYPISLSVMLTKIAEPNFDNVLKRINVVRSNQALARGMINVIDAGEALDSLKSIRIDDPFQDQGMRWSIESTQVELRGAGPDQKFGGPSYDATNGLVSRGDVIWSLPMEK